MAVLFVVFALALFFAIMQQRKASIVCIFLGLVLSLAMFWHHVTDVLKINL